MCPRASSAACTKLGVNHVNGNYIAAEHLARVNIASLNYEDQGNKNINVQQILYIWGVIRWISDFLRPCILETANHRAKRAKIWTLGVSSWTLAASLTNWPQEYTISA